MNIIRIIRLLGVFLIFCLIFPSLNAQCNQHVFTSVGAEKWTDFEYLDCEGNVHNFGLPAGGYTIIFCADIGTAFALNGDGFVYSITGVSQVSIYVSKYLVRLMLKGIFKKKLCLSVLRC